MGSLKKRRKDNRLILLYKGLKGKASVPTDGLIPKTRRARNHHSMAFQTPIANTDVYKGSFSPKTIRDWNASPIFWSHLLKMQRIVLLSSLLWWELGTNSLITGPGEWLSFRRFTSKLSWSCVRRLHLLCTYHIVNSFNFPITNDTLYNCNLGTYFRPALVPNILSTWNELIIIVIINKMIWYNQR